MATAVERKFTGLRKRLDQLGYRQPLGLESLPLVERLFNDLLHTTESLRNAKLQVTKNREQKGEMFCQKTVCILSGKTQLIARNMSHSKYMYTLSPPLFDKF